MCKAGSTDWVGWILGVRALDCQARGGLGFLPLEHGHSFSALGVITERTEKPAKPRLDECYPVRLVSSMDDDAQAWEVSDEARLGLQSVKPASSAPAPDYGNPQDGGGVRCCMTGNRLPSRKVKAFGLP